MDDELERLRAENAKLKTNIAKLEKDAGVLAQKVWDAAANGTAKIVEEIFHDQYRQAATTAIRQQVSALFADVPVLAQVIVSRDQRARVSVEMVKNAYTKRTIVEIRVDHNAFGMNIPIYELAPVQSKVNWGNPHADLVFMDDAPTGREYDPQKEFMRTPGNSQRMLNGLRKGRKDA